MKLLERIYCTVVDTSYPHGLFSAAARLLVRHLLSCGPNGRTTWTWPKAPPPSSPPRALSQCSLHATRPSYSSSSKYWRIIILYERERERACWKLPLAGIKGYSAASRPTFCGSLWNCMRLFALARGNSFCLACLQYEVLWCCELGRRPSGRNREVGESTVAVVSLVICKLRSADKEVLICWLSPLTLYWVQLI